MLLGEAKGFHISIRSLEDRPTVKGESMVAIDTDQSSQGNIYREPGFNGHRCCKQKRRW